jgi:hypothetical protein
MIKLIFKQPGLFSFVCLPILIFLLPGFIRPFQQNNDITLHDERLDIIPKEFYIVNVIDDRDDRRAVAWLLPSNNTEAQAQTSPYDFNGGFGAIKRFIENSISQNTALHPIVVHLKKFKVAEAVGVGGLAQGKAELVMTFELQQGDETQHLVDYTGNANYTRSAGPPQDVEPTLRKMLGSSLQYFDTWINKQAGGDIRLAKSVKISFSDYNKKPEGDTIYYSVNRPLTWDDFKGGIPKSRYAAEVSPSIAYSERAEVKDGVVRVNLEVNASLPKSACWAKDGVRDSYTLNHEQRHFDLAKIAAMHLIQKIKTEELPVGNYEGPINFDYVDAYRQMDTLEKKYDDETTHGLDHFAQGKWNERIDRELKELGVK